MSDIVYLILYFLLAILCAAWELNRAWKLGRNYLVMNLLVDIAALPIWPIIMFLYIMMKNVNIFAVIVKGNKHAKKQD